MSVFRHSLVLIAGLTREPSSFLSCTLTLPTWKKSRGYALSSYSNQSAQERQSDVQNCKLSRNG